ncbi:hypothetical protein RUM44_002630 [Polyplax serrata]|uniref:Uncharacterized protein n=1 Tax=Polyplax serrata TaxID=468196 RepID=A0ABR1AFA0_POLSC
MANTCHDTYLISNPKKEFVYHRQKKHKNINESGRGEKPEGIGGVDSGIDLLESLQLHNTSRQGVSTIPGPQRLRPAFYLQGKRLERK